MRIVTVLRSGGEYKPEHVERLFDQVERYAPGIEAACLSDAPAPNRIELKHDWPGWWAKMEMFRLSGPCFYMDLDTSVVGDIQPLLDVAQSRTFTVLREFNPRLRVMGSGLMAWNGDMRGLYKAFRADPSQHMRANRSRRWHGDQGFIERQTTDRSYWQDELPGMVVSYKKHCKHGVPKGARVVCFHGKPRPWEVESC